MNLPRALYRLIRRLDPKAIDRAKVKRARRTNLRAIARLYRLADEAEEEGKRTNNPSILHLADRMRACATRHEATYLSNLLS